MERAANGHRVFVAREGQEKSARKLAIRKPQRTAWIATLNGQQIDKHRARAIEEDVQWGRILRIQPS